MIFDRIRNKGKSVSGILQITIRPRRFTAKLPDCVAFPQVFGLFSVLLSENSEQFKRARANLLERQLGAFDLLRSLSNSA